MPPTLSREQTGTLIRASGLDADAQKAAEALLAPCILIERERIDGDLPRGSSRFGGDPDLPLWTRWPSYEGVPMMFVAQINLEEVAEVSHSVGLPSRGQIYLFADVESGDMELDCFRFIYVSNPRRWLRRRASPVPQSETVPPHRLIFRASWDLPDAGDAALGNAMDKFGEEYRALIGNFRGEHHYRHQLLGYPRSIQASTRSMAEALRFGGTSDTDNSSHTDLATRWQLLLQLDSDYPEDGPKFYWGDLGALTVWSFQDDFRTHRLRRSVLVPDCF